MNTTLFRDFFLKLSIVNFKNYISLTKQTEFIVWKKHLYDFTLWFTISINGFLRVAFGDSFHSKTNYPQCPPINCVLISIPNKHQITCNTVFHTHFYTHFKPTPHTLFCNNSTWFTIRVCTHIYYTYFPVHHPRDPPPHANHTYET